MSTAASTKPWRKDAAYPGQPEIYPSRRLQVSSWQDVKQEIGNAEAAGVQPINVRACGSHWAFSDVAVSTAVMIESNDPDELNNAAANRFNLPLYELIPEHLSKVADRFFANQPGAKQNPAIVQDGPFAVVHVQAGMKIAELYSFLDLDDHGGNHIGRRYAEYKGSWAMHTLGGAGGQTVAGATQTGTHGGDIVLPPIVDAVVAMHVIGAAGRHYWIESTSQPWGYLVEDDDLLRVYDRIEIVRDDDTLHAAAVSCGRFGVVYSVVLKVVRQYALVETRVESTWSAVRPWLSIYAAIAGAWFTQVVVNPLGQWRHPKEHSAWVTRRWRLPLSAAGNPPIGRAERAGVHAGTEVTFDPTDPDARNSFMNRVCEGAHPIRVAMDDLIKPFVDARNIALIGAGVAEAAIIAATTFGLPAPPPLIYARDQALLAAAAAQATITLLELVKTLAPASAKINEALGDISNFLAEIDQLWVLHALSDVLMGNDQKPRTATAISYALMDTHNYRDWNCSRNGDSIELFFNAWTTDAVNFIDSVFSRIQQMEDGELPETEGERMTFPGYVSFRFTRQTAALLGMQRWPYAVSVEIASVNACKGTSRLLSRIHQDAIEYIGPSGPRASLHWGQKNTADMNHVEAAFGAWVPGGRLNLWRKILSQLTRNSRDATFSTPFTRHAGLEVVQPLAYFVTVSSNVACAGANVTLTWDAMNNPPGTTARLMLREKRPGAPTRTVGWVDLAGSLPLEVPAGRYDVILEVEYELNGRRLRDLSTTDIRGIVAGDTVTFQFVPSCWQFGGASRWWIDINMGEATFAPGVLVQTLRLAPTTGGPWRATRSGKPDILLPSGLTTVSVVDHPSMRDGSWRFMSEDVGCLGAAPTVTIEFGLTCGAV